MQPDLPTYLLKIEGRRPHEMPLEALLPYMQAIKTILGVGVALHLVGLEDASTGLALQVDRGARPEAEENALAAAAGLARPRVQSGFERLKALAQNDNNPVRLLRSDATEVFSVSVAVDDDVDIGPVQRDGFLQGRIVGIVGADETKHVRLLDGERLYTGIVATEELAVELGQHLFTEVVRLHGRGVWWRRAGAGWSLERFAAHRYERLDGRPLPEIVADIRELRSSRWHVEADPWGELQQLRGED